MDELIERLRRLPKQSRTCQGGVFAWPHFVQEEGGAPFRPYFPLWADLESGAIHTDSMLAPDQDLLRASLETLGGFVEKLLGNRACPRRLEVCDPELAEYLRRNLAGAGIEVELQDQLPILEAVLAEMAEMVEGRIDGPPSLLDSRGVTIERLHAFADAAAEFYRAAPWRYLTDSDLIQIESPKPPRGMACVVVLGAGRSAYGLGLYSSRTAYERFLRAGQDGEYEADIAAGLAQVIFDPIEELPAADALLWADHQLPVAGEQAYPFVVKYLSDGEFARPSKKELTFLEGLLRALAGTSESEMDSGRWRKAITTFDGPATLTLAIPDLLDPPSSQEWMRRGFAPDRRAHERIFADMDRYLEENPPSGDDDRLETINRLYAGRSFHDPLTSPRTPAEHAWEMCFQAFDAHGRRRVQLARRALQLDPDCADAHVILAEQAGTIDDQLDHYQRGMEAAERTHGSAFFAENVGHFWGISATRPYMRARLGLAESLATIGRVDEAIEHYQELLRLNPNDNQGVRYLLLPRLLAAGRDQDAAKLLKEFDEESANWTYARALLAFRLSGRSPAASRELQAAMRVNSHVSELLGSDSPIPQPPHYSPGSFEEACVAAEELRPAYQATPGALDWIAEAQFHRSHESNAASWLKPRKKRAERKKRKKR